MKNIKLNGGNFTNEAEKIFAAQQEMSRTVEPTKMYRETYLQKNDMEYRHCAYIGKDVYEYLAEVVRVVAHNKISVGGYINNILKEHRAAHNETLKDMFRQECEKGLHCG